MGRPLLGPTARTETITVRVTPDEKQRLMLLGSPSAGLRHLIDRWTKGQAGHRSEPPSRGEDVSMPPAEASPAASVPEVDAKPHRHRPGVIVATRHKAGVKQVQPSCTGCSQPMAWRPAGPGE